MRRFLFTFGVAIGAAGVAHFDSDALVQGASASAEPAGRTQSVSGTGVHYFTTAMIHSKTPTESGIVQRSTEIVELDGDLKGRVLYQPVSVFDFVKGTLVNTGHQVFSGTILGSEPVMIYDDEFRFEVNLKTGVEFGEVHLTDRIAGPKVRCDLIVTGSGAVTPEGNAIAEYTGTCAFRGK